MVAHLYDGVLMEAAAEVFTRKALSQRYHSFGER